MGRKGIDRTVGREISKKEKEDRDETGIEKRKKESSKEE